MKSLNFDSKEVFEGTIMLYVYDKHHLENLIRNYEILMELKK